MKEFKFIISALDSYIKQSTRDRRTFSPVLHNIKKTMEEDNNKNKSEDTYFKTLYTMTEKYGVDQNYVKYEHQEKGLLFNAPVAFSWIRDYMAKMHKHVYSIEHDVTEKLEKYENLSKDFNINVDKEIEAIKTYINNYKNTDVYNNFYKENSNKNDVLKEIDICLRDLSSKSWDLSMKGEIPNNSFVGQNYPTDFRKSPELADLVVLIDKAKVEFSNYFVDNKDIVDLTETFKLVDNVDGVFENIHLKLRNKGYQSSLAETYADDVKDTSVLGFLKNKTAEPENLKLTELPEWCSIKKVIIFEDGSILLQNKDNNYKEILSNKDLTVIRNKLINDYIHEEFKKKPTIEKTFKKINELVYLDHFSDLNRVVDKYKENEAILKLNDFELMNAFKEAAESNKRSYSIYEKFDDAMSKIVHDHKVKQFINSIASNKYNHLYDEKTYKIASNLYDLNLPDNSLQEYIGKKIAAFKTPEEFNGALSKFLESLNSFTMEATVNKAEKFGVQIISENDNKLILRINDFEESKTMGSSSWCISREESYFHSYADGAEQYFLFDFSKENTDNASMIGITLHTNGDYSTAHYKDDSECEEGEGEEEMIQYVQDEVYEYKAELKEKNKIDQKDKLKVY